MAILSQKPALVFQLLRRIGFDSLFLTPLRPTTQVSGHDFSALPEMTLSLSKGSRGLRSRAEKAADTTIPCAAGPRAAAPGMPGFLGCWDAMQRSARKKDSEDRTCGYGFGFFAPPNFLSKNSAPA